MFSTWPSTVRGESTRVWAIARLLRPSATSLATLFSRAVKGDFVSSGRSQSQGDGLLFGEPRVICRKFRQTPRAEVLLNRLRGAGNRLAGGPESVDGGSAIGLAKAVALTGLPIVAVPTGYAGSEATNVWGIIADQRTSTGVDDRVPPASVIYDVGLTLSLPVEFSVASGLNSLAHCIDALWAPAPVP
jgi:hypothetical protein